MTESTLVPVKDLEAIMRLLDVLSVKLQDRKLWELVTQCEQAKAYLGKWVFKDE